MCGFILLFYTYAVLCIFYSMSFLLFKIFACFCEIKKYSMETEKNRVLSYVAGVAIVIMVLSVKSRL